MAVHIATKINATTAKKRKIFLLLIGRHFTHLVNRVDYRHALPIFHITITYRADGVGLYGDAHAHTTAFEQIPVRRIISTSLPPGIKGNKDILSKIDMVVAAGGDRV